MRRLGALATFSAHACEGSRSSGITQKLDERLHPGTTVHRGTRFILPSIGLTGAPCQCLVGSHIVIWYHTRPRQLTRLSSESSSLHAQPPRCQSNLYSEVLSSFGNGMVWTWGWRSVFIGVQEAAWLLGTSPVMRRHMET
ncbi:unnamed protein product [Microthlaspi erraticum]|uniref:Uncharacterized protein n=1 Tax=Microthlaspi erraticum TaxID=1685480 RepID=A0A6D2I2A2_9BRAS|nr:unnamed protein product [Microthlaspi erraticum]